ncbi:MAG: choice-of-anchor B family protein, partial [Bacteroidota bacterium]
MKRYSTWPVLGLLLLPWIVDGQNAPFRMELIANVPNSGDFANDVWGYVAPDGVEYAIIGSNREAVIYSLEDPTQPTVIAEVPGATSIWRDFKVYENYVYQTTDQGSDGVTIIDMAGAPDSISSILWQPEVNVDGFTSTLRRCHNLWIDTLRGHMYLSGCNIGVGGVIIADLNQDPTSPVVIGVENQRYSHDVITRGDTLFASEINEGNLGIYDISDPANALLLSRTATTSFFTHNAWYADDGRYVFTTDERPNSRVDAYDITDITQPERVDTYQPPERPGALPHNVHYLDGYLVTSWYSEGIIILDAHRPHNLVEVASYDTYPQGIRGGEGCWGAYPFLPSGLVLGSDITNGLFVLDPDYQRAAYLEGLVIDAVTREPINNVRLELNTTRPLSEQTTATGSFAMGTAESGDFVIKLTHPDFESMSGPINLSSGIVTDTVFALQPKGRAALDVIVVNPEGQFIPGANLVIRSEQHRFDVDPEALRGPPDSIPLDNYEVFTAAWGFRGSRSEVSLSTDEQIVVELTEGYEDDFFADLGWEVEGDALTGIWERAIPEATFLDDLASNPGSDSPIDLGSSAYVTGNLNTDVGVDDVDDGVTRLVSPPIPIEAYVRPELVFSYWFFNNGATVPFDDTLKVYLRQNNQDQLIFEVADIEGQSGMWVDSAVVSFDKLLDRNQLNYQIVFEASDVPGSGNIVEAGIDRFRIKESEVTTSIVSSSPKSGIRIWPNPVKDNIMVTLPPVSNIKNIDIYDTSGRLIREAGLKNA